MHLDNILNNSPATPESDGANLSEKTKAPRTEAQREAYERRFQVEQSDEFDLRRGLALVNRRLQRRFLHIQDVLLKIKSARDAAIKAINEELRNRAHSFSSENLRRRNLRALYPQSDETNPGNPPSPPAERQN